jgi:hypothetical protein
MRGAEGERRQSMEFMSSRPDIVRAASQRGLLSLWNRLRGAGSLPQWRDVDSGEFGPVDNLSYSDVIASHSATRYLIRFHGQRIAELYGRTSCVGKYLDEILPPSYSATALSTYHQVVASKLPVYTVADMRDAAGRIVHYERLLLPFSRDGASVDRILASLEAVSPEGEFDQRDLMKAPPKPPAFALCTIIQH